MLQQGYNDLHIVTNNKWMGRGSKWRREWQKGGSRWHERRGLIKMKKNKKTKGWWGKKRGG
jgi:hypothetical protein